MLHSDQNGVWSTNIGIKTLPRIIAVFIGFSPFEYTQAVTVSGTFTDSFFVTSECQIVSSNTLKFDTPARPSNKFDAIAHINVQCTASTPYRVSLHATPVDRLSNINLNSAKHSNSATYTVYSGAKHRIKPGIWLGHDQHENHDNTDTQTLTIYGHAILPDSHLPAIFDTAVTVTVTY